MPFFFSAIPKSPMKTLQIRCELDYVATEEADYVFNVQAAHHAWQNVLTENLAVEPAAQFAFGLHPSGLNRLAKMHGAAGEMRLRYDAVVQVNYPLPTGREEELTIANLPVEVIPYIWSSRYCESDAVLQVVGRTFGQLAQAAIRRRGYESDLPVDPRQHRLPGRHFGADHVDARGAGQPCRGVPRLRAPGHHVLQGAEHSGALCHQKAIYLVRGAAARIFARLRCSRLTWAGAEILFDATQLAPMMTDFVRIATGKDAADTAFATIFGAR